MNRDFICFGIPALLVLIVACNSDAEHVEKQNTSSADAAVNCLANLNLEGYPGELLRANENAWLHRVLLDNPNLFGAFEDPEDTSIFKTWWHGEFPGKILQGMAQTYRAFNNPHTLAAGNEMAARFKSVQGEDGYLGPWPTANRFNGDTIKWDTWGHYHCIYGLYQWYKITGNKDALEVAVKAADCIYDHFILGRQSFVSQNWAEMNLAISHGFALLYQETGDDRYLEAAEYIVQKEWKLEYDDYFSKSRLACDWLGAAMDGKAFYQSNQKRWESLHTLMTLAPLYQVSGLQEYYDALEHYWWSIVQHDRHNFGGFGTGEGATGDLYGHGSETCNTIAWMAFSTEYLRLAKDSYVADEIELSYYNGAMGSLLGEHDFTYMNDSDGSRESALITLAVHGFRGGRELSCCQANGNRGISMITEWGVLTGKEKLYLNYYGACSAETLTPGGGGICLVQETDYPKSGSVRISLSMDRKERFGLMLRIPSWSENTELRVNGDSYENISPGAYFELDRKWKEGDIIELDLDMSIHYWIGDDECKGKTSIFYGPVLLAMESDSSGASGYILDPASLKELKFSENEGFWFYGFARTMGGEKVPLVDYSSAGDRGADYSTWLKVSHGLEPLAREEGDPPIWNRRN